MRSRVVIPLGIVLVAVLAVSGVLVLRHGGRTPAHAGAASPSARRGRAVSAPGSVPPAAASAVQLLVSARGRTALTPELNSVLRPGTLFPAGTTFTAKPGSWHQAGAYANVTGTLQIPGHAAERAEIGLVHRSGRWLVTFEGKLR